MTRLRTSFLATVTLSLALTFASSAFAGPAQDFVSSRHASLTAELSKPPSPARQKNVDNLLNGFFDFDKLTRDALARNYDDLSQDEYNELKSLLQALVTKNYKKNIEKTLNYEVKFLQDNAIEGGRLVRTEVQKRNSKEAPLEIDYALHQRDDAWMVYDIITDGSSMLRNYRNQFGNVIRRDGFPELLKRLQRRLDEP